MPYVAGVAICLAEDVIQASGVGRSNIRLKLGQIASNCAFSH